MGRPPLPLGTAGTITVISAAGGLQRARCRFRDYDGQVRLVERTGRTKTAAENALKAALRDRQGPAGDTITGDTRLRDLGTEWLAEIEQSDRAIGTKQHYRYVLTSYVEPAVGGLRVREATVGALDRALGAIQTQHGKAAAKSTRSVLSGLIGLAARHDAISSNPVRDTSKISGRTERARALTVEETENLTDKLRSNARAVALDLPDLVDFMLGTGCRIDEASAARYGRNPEGRPLLDLEAGTWEVNATVVRRNGVGLFVQDRTKSDAGWRVLALPAYLVAMLDRRASELRLNAPDGIVFGSPAARALRDPSNTPGDLRQVLDAIDCPTCDGATRIPDPARPGRSLPCRDAGPYSWVHSHVFRKTVATRMDEAGCSAREIADQLGHSKPSMTQDVYMGRNVVSASAADVLDR